MTIATIILAISFFCVNLFLNLKYGSSHPMWPLLIFVILFVGLYVYGWANGLEFPSVGFLLFMLAMLMTKVIAFPFLRKRAGELILTYKRSLANLLFTTPLVVLILVESFMMGLPNRRSYQTHEPIYDKSYYLEQLPISILVGLLGLSFVPTIFRKGEIFENGFANQDMQFYFWNEFKSYQFVENPKKKKDERFSLNLLGGRNYDYTIHGFSESTKSILDETLSTKLKKIPESGNSALTGQGTAAT